MRYAVKPIPFKPHRLDGLSSPLLESHYENNYGGALRRLNAIEQRLGALDWTKAPVFEINGLKREQLIAANSVILHEIYFDGLGGGGDPAGELAAGLERDFGSVGQWNAEFTAMGRALGGGSGWVILSWSDRFGRLVNQWAADHTHVLAESRPLLALDMYEHAYHLDFGAKVGPYVDAFMKNIAWERVAARFAEAKGMGAKTGPASTDGASQMSVEELSDRLARGEKCLVLDVRLAEDLALVQDRLPASPWRDPQNVQAWIDDLPRDQPIVAFCMFGFWVSQDTVAALRARGLDAYSLAGGIAAWRAMGGRTEPLER